jgi:hypothetical protein
MADIKNFFVLFILFFRSATSQTTEADKIDNAMTADRQKCIDAQSTIASMHTSLSTSVASLITIIRSNSYSKDLLTALENLNSRLKMQSTVKDYEPYVKISTCGDVNLKITMIDFDQQKHLRVINRARMNVSDLSVTYSQVAGYSGQIVTTQYYTNVTSIITRTAAILTEYSKMISVIFQSYANCAVNSVLLNTFKRTYCTCLKTASMTGYNSTLVANVNVVESRLVTLQESVRNHTTNALNNVKNAYTSITSKFLKWDLLLLIEFIL